ncbi:MAG: protein translocase SEC61 complex subunit gamma [Candidatus Poseidoniales archaeon]|nr:MAG: protein translocase SEC61 complex subunit gamma [Candidatus Poseidoniales archaeon]
MLKWSLSVAESLRGLVMAIESSNAGAIEDTVQSWQDDIEGRVRSLQTGPYARILKMARKPSKQEFRQTVIVCGIGMFILGAIGFVMLWLMDSAFPSFFNWLTE